MGKRLVLSGLLLGGLWYWLNGPLSAPMSEQLATMVRLPSTFDSALSINQAPLQREIEEAETWHLGNIEITPKAEFQIEARVLGRRDYRRDEGAVLAPVDLALGWGRMAQDEVLAELEISQRRRFYYWRTDDFPIPRGEIESSSANMHLIPASPEVFEVIKTAERNQRVRLRGYLVDVQFDDGWTWRSSTTRNDTGNGACELVLVTLADIR